MRRLIEPQARLAHVTFHHFHFFFEKSSKLSPMPVVKRVERGGFLDDLFKAPHSGRCAVAANQQRNLADVGNVFEQIRQPDLTDESGHSDQQKMPVRQVLADRKFFDSRSFPEQCDRFTCRNRLSRGRLYCSAKLLGFLCPTQLAQKSFTGDPAVRPPTGNPCERPARTHDGIEQPPRGFAVTKFQAVGNKRIHSEMVR